MPYEEFYAPTLVPAGSANQPSGSFRGSQLSTTLHEYYGPSQPALPGTQDPISFQGASFETNIDLTSFDTLFGHTGPVVCVAFSPQGTQVAAGSKDGTVRVWSLVKKTPRRDLIGHTDIVECIAFSGDGTLMASGSGDGTIRVWILSEGRTRRELKGHGGAVRAVTFARNGTKVVSCSEDRTIRVWDVKAGDDVTVAGQKPQLVAARFSTGANVVAVSSSGNNPTVKLFDLKDPGFRFLSGLNNVAHAMAFSTDGKTLAAGLADNTVQFWDVAKDETRVLVGHQAPVFAVACSSDGKLIASGSADGTMRIWNKERGRNHLLVNNEAKVWSVEFSPDGTLVVIGLGNGNVRLLGAVARQQPAKETKTFTSSFKKMFQSKGTTSPGPGS